MRPVVGHHEHDVLRLQIPVHDAAAMCSRKRIEHLRHQPSGIDGRQRPLHREPVVQGPALNALEYGEQPPVGRFPIQQRHDVRVPQRLAQARLAPEAHALARALGFGPRDIVPHQLDRDVLPVSPQVARNTTPLPPSPSNAPSW